MINKISVKLKITIWYILILIITSLFVLDMTAGLNKVILIKDVEKNVITAINNLEKKMIDLYEESLVNDSEYPFYKDKIKEYDLFSEGTQLIVYNENKDVVFGFNPYGINTNSKESVNIFSKEKHNEKEYLYIDRKVEFNNNSYLIRGTTCITDKLEVVVSTTKYNCIIIFLFVLIAGFGGYLIIDRAFIPVNQIRETAIAISKSSDLSRRIDIGNGRDEIHTLANTFNEMLDKLEDAFEKEKQFTSDVSHELRTPISVILSECEYAENCIDNIEEYKETIGNIKIQGEKMSKLVSELLMFSRMDNNKVNLNLEKTNISELLTFVCEEQNEIRNKNIELITNINPDIYANVDTLLITRLFINIISNAYQYTPENKKIWVSLKENETEIIFSVKDEGIGISEEHLDKIWNRFYQVDSSRTSEKENSSGLGLSMVKWIADKHGGKLKVESKLNEGSTFSFILNK